MRTPARSTTSIAPFSSTSPSIEISQYVMCSAVSSNQRICQACIPGSPFGLFFLRKPFISTSTGGASGATGTRNCSSSPGRQSGGTVTTTLPPYTLGRPLHPLNVWLGTRGTVTSLHSDASENLLAQVAGHKYVRLYGLDQTPHLYASLQRGGAFGTSPVRVEAAASATLGLVATAQGALWYFHADAAHDDEFGDEA